MNVSSESMTWLGENEEKIDAMFEWLNTAPEENE
jgi:hypothetical protein